MDGAGVDLVIEALETVQAELTLSLPEHRRLWFKTQSLEKVRGALITGPRGVGKTTFLLIEAQKKGSLLYASADHPLVASCSLTEIAKAAFTKGYQGLIVDEVHHAREWEIHLKSLYDSYPRKAFWASDSSSLILRKGQADLSRRFPAFTLPLLSFREYLSLAGHGERPIITPFDSPKLDLIQEYTKDLNISGLFRQHVETGMRPFYVEGLYRERIFAVLEKTILSDVPTFVSKISENMLRLMRAVMGHIAVSAIPTVNVESLCRDWNIGKSSLYHLLEVLVHVGLLSIVRYENDNSVMTKGAKIFFTDPSFYHVLGGTLGNVREAYVVSQMQAAGIPVFASRDETKGDLICGSDFVEIGGKGKKRKKADWVIRDDVEVPSPKVIPLWCVGCMR
jgi:predicted AAA+ superfamily ATPase